MGVTTNNVPLIGMGNSGASPVGPGSSSPVAYGLGARSVVEGYDPAVTAPVGLSELMDGGYCW